MKDKNDRYLPRSMNKDLLWFPHLQPRVSSGRPGLRTAMRILSACEQNVARCPRMHGSLHLRKRLEAKR